MNEWVKVLLQRSAVIADLATEIVSRAPVSVEITESTRIADDLEMDSLAIMNFIMAIEDKYDLSLSVDQIAEVRTIGELADEIVRLTNESAAT